jgi:hypothetical protein
MGKGRKKKYRKGKMPKIKTIQMSLDRNGENDSVLKYKFPSPSPSVLHVHFHLSFLFSTFFLSAFFHHTFHVNKTQGEKKQTSILP